MALEKVADGVWLLRGDFRGAMNIYFLEDGDGVVQFDAGTKAMRKKAKVAAAELGGLKRVVLGHAHADHRGTAPYMDVPVLCHPDEVADAESGAAIAPYMDLSQLPVAWVRRLYPFLLRRWDGGAVKAADTVIEGDEVAGFKVLHFPGHAPGLIGLWRESDRVGLNLDPLLLDVSGSGVEDEIDVLARPDLVLDVGGRSGLLGLHAAAGGRLVGADEAERGAGHFGQLQCLAHRLRSSLRAIGPHHDAFEHAASFGRWTGSILTLAGLPGR